MKRAFKYFPNKYLICLTILVLHILFTEETNLFELVKMKRTLSESKLNIDKMRNEIEATTKANLELTTDMVAKEKFAREKYHMKKKDEDIVVIGEK